MYHGLLWWGLALHDLTFKYFFGTTYILIFSTPEIAVGCLLQSLSVYGLLFAYPFNIPRVGLGRMCVFRIDSAKPKNDPYTISTTPLTVVMVLANVANNFRFTACEI
jgi:hypothetical protein